MQLHKVAWACMQFHELACSYMSLHAVPLAWMQSFFVWAAHKNFAVLVFSRAIWGGLTRCLLLHSHQTELSPHHLRENSEKYIFSIIYIYLALKFLSKGPHFIGAEGWYLDFRHTYMSGFKILKSPIDTLMLSLIHWSARAWSYSPMLPGASSLPK